MDGEASPSWQSALKKSVTRSPSCRQDLEGDALVAAEDRDAVAGEEDVSDACQGVLEADVTAATAYAVGLLAPSTGPL
jgi:hypothetical protein